MRMPRCTAALLPLALLGACGGPREPSTLPVPLAVRTHVDTTYYDVDGRTPREWLASMAREARLAGVGAPYHAHTEWRTRWSYAASRRTAAGCEPVNPSVSAEVQFIMPRLRDEATVSDDARAEWRRYLTSLWRHEEGHALRGLRAAEEQRDTMRHLRAASCELLAAQLRSTMDAVIDRFRRSNREYDALSGHGARQGALLITDPRARLPVDTTFRDVLP